MKKNLCIETWKMWAYLHPNLKRRTLWNIANARVTVLYIPCFPMHWTHRQLALNVTLAPATSSVHPPSEVLKLMIASGRYPYKQWKRRIETTWWLKRKTSQRLLADCELFSGPVCFDWRGTRARLTQAACARTGLRPSQELTDRQSLLSRSRGKVHTTEIDFVSFVSFVYSSWS